MVGIRTASHAFTLRNKPAPDGLDAWPEFDNEVWGGNYSNHWGNQLVATVNVIKKNADHPILAGVPAEKFTSGGSLYLVSPLIKGATPLLRGRVEGHDPEPMAWAFTRADGGRSFYTSLGYIDDFQTPAFVRMLKNAVDWAAAGVPGQKSAALTPPQDQDGWSPVTLPVADQQELVSTVDVTERSAEKLDPAEWYRCYVSVDHRQISGDQFHVELPFPANDCEAWLNGKRMTSGEGKISAPSSVVTTDDVNALVLCVTTVEAREKLLRQGVTVLLRDANAPLHGTWQHRLCDGRDFSGLSLPAQYAASPDAIFELK